MSERNIKRENIFSVAADTQNIERNIRWNIEKYIFCGSKQTKYWDLWQQTHKDRQRIRKLGCLVRFPSDPLVSWGAWLVCPPPETPLHFLSMKTFDITVDYGDHRIATWASRKRRRSLSDQKVRSVHTGFYNFIVLLLVLLLFYYYFIILYQKDRSVHTGYDNFIIIS